MHQSFDFQLLVRQGEKTDALTRAERTSADFLVDGQALLSVLTKADGGHADYMGCFVRGFASQNEQKLVVLTGHGSPETEEGRYLLYVCPECGDIGCGSYAVRIRFGQDSVEWYDFAYENGYEPGRALSTVGPFMFSRARYESVLTRASAA